MPQIFVQSTNERLDYKAEFMDSFQSGEAIQGVPTWSVMPAGPTLDGQVDTVDDSTIFFSGAIDHAVTYRLLCKISTNFSRDFERTLFVRGWDR